MVGLIYLVDTDSGSYTTGVLINIHTAAARMDAPLAFFAYVYPAHLASSPY